MSVSMADDTTTIDKDCSRPVANSKLFPNDLTNIEFEEQQASQGQIEKEAEARAEASRQHEERERAQQLQYLNSKIASLEAESQFLSSRWDGEIVSFISMTGALTLDFRQCNFFR